MWLKFLNEATGGELHCCGSCSKSAGYFLTGRTNEEKVFFLHGPGGNGKGVFISTITGIMDGYAKSAPMQTFTASKHERHLTELARLHDARLVTASETEENTMWATARLKELSGNECRITANYMRQDHFEYKARFKICLIGNNRPRLGNVDEAIKRRLLLVPFENKPKRPDLDLKEKLVGEYPAILRWMIEGCVDWQQNGLIIPKKVKEASNEYFEDEDLRQQWHDECLSRYSTRDFTLIAELHQSWAQWVKSRNMDAGSPTATSQWLQRRGYSRTKTTAGRGFRGLSIVRSEWIDD